MTTRLLHSVAALFAQAGSDANDVVTPSVGNVPATAPAATRPAGEALLSIADGRFLGNNVWQWAGLLAALLASFIVGKTVAYFLERRAERIQAGDRFRVLGMICHSLVRPVKMIALSAGLYVSGTFLTFPASTGLADLWDKVCMTLAVLAAGWFIYRLVDIIEFFLHRWTSETESQLDDQLVPLLRKTLRVFVVIIAALFIAQNVFQWDIAALIAGLGIGGLAFALAAQDTIANLFGSVTVFADRPFQLGDRIKFQGYDGMVEEVGFRSTRIRTLDGHLVTVPNSAITTSSIENVSGRPSIKRVLNVTVTYDTPPEKLQRGVDILREMLAARSEHFPEDFPPKVYFSDYNAESLNIVVYYWFDPPEWWDYLEFNHDFNMELLTRFNEEGIEFAFPTQTLYVKQDSPLEADIRLARTS